MSDTDSDKDGKERVAKRVARAGVGSRRDVERWIAEGRVKVNGAVLTAPGTLVGPDDDIQVDGKAIPRASRTRMWAYHKPYGLVTSHRDEKGRETIFDHLPAELPRVISIGRLDLTSEGLLLLTNDGELARSLELPASGWVRRYRARAHGRVGPGDIERLRRGITVEGVQYGPIEAIVERQQGANVWMTLSLTEGKNREIRRVLAALDLTVNRLIRVAYGPFELGELKAGHVREIPPAQVPVVAAT